MAGKEENDKPEENTMSLEMCLRCLCLFFFTALLSEGKSQPRDSLQNSSKAAEFILNGLPKSVSESRYRATQTLGKPVKSEIDLRTNIHLPGVIDSIVSLQYRGANLRFFVPGIGNPSKEFIIEAEIASSKIRLRPGIKIGDEQSFVINSIGFPKVYSKDSLVYEDEESPNKITLYFRERKLEGLKWKFYWD